MLVRCTPISLILPSALLMFSAFWIRRTGSRLYLPKSDSERHSCVKSQRPAASAGVLTYDELDEARPVREVRAKINER